MASSNSLEFLWGEQLSVSVQCKSFLSNSPLTLLPQSAITLADNCQGCQSIPTGVGPGGVPCPPAQHRPSRITANSLNMIISLLIPQCWDHYCRSWWPSFPHSRTSRVSASLSSSSASSSASSPSPSSWWRRPTAGPGWLGSGSHCRTSPQTSSQPTPSTPPGYQVCQVWNMRQAGSVSVLL